MNSLTPAQLEELLNALPDPDSGIEALHGHDTPSWSVVFASGAVHQIDWTDADTPLGLTGSIGLPAPGHELAMLNAALLYNALWASTGSLRIARDDADGDLLLMAQVPTDGLDTARLRERLLHFERIRSAWSLAVGHPAPPGCQDLPLDQVEWRA